MSNPAAWHVRVFYIEFGFSPENIVGSPKSPQSIEGRKHLTTRWKNPAYFHFYLIAAIAAFIMAAFSFRVFQIWKLDLEPKISLYIWNGMQRNIVHKLVRYGARWFWETFSGSWEQWCKPKYIVKPFSVFCPTKLKDRSSLQKAYKY